MRVLCDEVEEDGPELGLPAGFQRASQRSHFHGLGAASPFVAAPALQMRQLRLIGWSLVDGPSSGSMGPLTGRDAVVVLVRRARVAEDLCDFSVAWGAVRHCRPTE